MALVVRVVDFEDRDATRLVDAYFAELRERLGGFEPPTVEQRRADAASGAVLVAYADGAAIACGSLRVLDAARVEVKRMFVIPEARGRGVSRTLLAALEDHARVLGGTRIVLDTAAPLVEAQRLYLRAGYTEVQRYNDNPYAACWFEKALASPRFDK